MASKQWAAVVDVDVTFVAREGNHLFRYTLAPAYMANGVPAMLERNRQRGGDGEQLRGPLGDRSGRVPPADNIAATFEEMIDHYIEFFKLVRAMHARGPVSPSATTEGCTSIGS